MVAVYAPGCRIDLKRRVGFLVARAGLIGQRLLTDGQTAGSCCGPEKLQAGQRPAFHFAAAGVQVTVVSVTQAHGQARAVVFGLDFG